MYDCVAHSTFVIQFVKEYFDTFTHAVCVQTGGYYCCITSGTTHMCYIKDCVTNNFFLMVTGLYYVGCAADLSS